MLHTENTKATKPSQILLCYTSIPHDLDIFVFFFIINVIFVDNHFNGFKDNLRKWIDHPRFDLILPGNFLYPFRYPLKK